MTGIKIDFPNTVYVSDKENNVIQAFSSPSIYVTKISNDKMYENIHIQSTIKYLSITESIRQTSSIDLNKIPDTLYVTFEDEDNYFQLIGIIDRNDEISVVNDEVDVLDLMFEIDDWNIKLTFQFIEGSDIGLVDIKQVLIGKIKSYSTIQKALASCLLWKDNPLNQEVVLKIKEKGLNFVLIQTQFTNGTTGIYSGIMDVNPTINYKSYYKDTLKGDLKNDKSLKVIRSFTPKINNDLTFFRVAEMIVCDNLLNSGFKNCE